MAKKNIFEARNPFSNLNNENTKNFVKQFEEEEQIKHEIMKIKGSKISSITKEIISKIDFEDREFINREISFKKNLEKENIHNLADSINDIGLINPVYVIENKNKKYKILSGFRRLSAIFYGYEKIEEFNVAGTNNIIIIPENTPYDILDKISLHENTLRENLTVLELSMKIWSESRKKKKKTERIVKEYGLSERTIARYLRVEKYPKELLSKLENIGNIRKSDTIYNYLKEINFENIDKEIKKMVKLEVSEIEKEIKKRKSNDISDDKMIIKRGKKTVFEISEQLSDAQISKIRKLILENMKK